MKRTLDDLEQHAAYHAKAIQAVIDGQLERTSAANLQAAGGGAMIIKNVVALIRRQLT